MEDWIVYLYLAGGGVSLIIFIILIAKFFILCEQFERFIKVISLFQSIDEKITKINRDTEIIREHFIKKG